MRHGCATVLHSMVSAYATCAKIEYVICIHSSAFFHHVGSNRIEYVIIRAYDSDNRRRVKRMLGLCDYNVSAVM